MINSKIKLCSELHYITTEERTINWSFSRTFLLSNFFLVWERSLLLGNTSLTKPTLGFSRRYTYANTNPKQNRISSKKRRTVIKKMQFLTSGTSRHIRHTQSLEYHRLVDHKLGKSIFYFRIHPIWKRERKFSYANMYIIHLGKNNRNCKVFHG